MKLILIFLFSYLSSQPLTSCSTPREAEYEWTWGQVVSVEPMHRAGRPDRQWVRLRCQNGKPFSFHVDTANHYQLDQWVHVTTKR